jgi:hypothetical protein
LSPRPGGEADKIGNRYESAWAIRHALYCLVRDDCSMTVEALDPDEARGAEFTFVERGKTQVHQVKRQFLNNNAWSISALARLGVFSSAIGHVAAGREYHLVSLIPCGNLRELAERARGAVDLTTFTQHSLATNQDLRATFDELSAPKLLGTPEQAWKTLRRMWFEVREERETMHDNGLLAELTLEGAPARLMALGLGDVLNANLGLPLTRKELLEELADMDVTLRPVGSKASTRTKVAEVTNNWRQSVQRELLEPPIMRAEAERVVESLKSGLLTLILGNAGDGKSAILEQTVERLEAASGTVLAFRLDRRLTGFMSTDELGRQLGLDMSPAAALKLAAGDSPAYLVIDQLDAVSLASGRMPENFDAVADLIAEAALLPQIGVVLACRGFDVENDHRIRTLTSRRHPATVEVRPLTDAEVNDAVDGMGLNCEELTPEQRNLLRSPLHLVLLASIASQPDALSFYSSGSLFASFWERKRQTARMRAADVRFTAVVEKVANTASDQQSLAVPLSALDEDELIDHATVLISEHVLAREGDRVAFFHEAFFDYAFARQWVSRSESLVQFLCRAEQELFRRAQVRQILRHLHEQDPDRFVTECEAALNSDDIRFHIKETVVAVISNLAAPTSEEAELVLRVCAEPGSVTNRLWQQLQRPQWFARLHEDGVLEAWLDSADQADRERAALFLGNQARRDLVPVAAMLKSRRSAADYPDWLRWVVRVGDLETSRDMFDLLLDAIRAGLFDGGYEEQLWMSAHDLGKREPLLAIELLRAFLVERTGAMDLDAAGKVTALEMRNYSASKVVHEAAEAAPLAFATMAVPYLRAVMAATAREPADDGRVYDEHFSLRMVGSKRYERDFDEALLGATVGALEKLAASAPEEIRSTLETLAADPYESSQYLLYRALTAGEARFADWAADLLLEGGPRYRSGYVSEPRWVSREMLRAIAPHINDDRHRQLEDAVRDMTDQYEKPASRGRTAFAFLSALDESRLSELGGRRLAEYRRKFDANQPEAPQRIMGGGVPSPISSSSAEHMTDDQWLRAMAKHSSEHPDNWGTGLGSAHELSSVLREQVDTNPVRFARLALSMTDDLNDSYATAVLMGLGDADFPEGDVPALYDAVKHLSALPGTDTDRWLGWALQKQQADLPLEMVELILDRALNAIDPADDAPRITQSDKDGNQVVDLHANGINTSRGSLADALGNLLVNDVTGERTELVRPHLQTLASDPVVYVRAEVAYTIAASLRHARSDAVAAFTTLIDGADDVLLAAVHTYRLMQYIGNVDSDVISPVITRMLNSTIDDVRKVGGQLAALAALQWNLPHHLTHALTLDSHVRAGVAGMCSAMVDQTSNPDLAIETLTGLMNDKEHEVRAAVASLAPRLRDKKLRPFANLLKELIASDSYSESTPQLLLTLQHAPDRVDDLSLLAAQRFLQVYGKDAGDIRTAAAGDSSYVSELVVRGLAQSRSPRERSALLDVLDQLLEIGAYGIAKAIDEAGRA